MALAQITNHEQLALSRQRQMYKNTTRFNGYVSAFCQEVQEIEDAFWDSMAGRYLSSARGSVLDAYGKRFGVARNGLDDNTYRAIVNGAIAVANSQGRTEDVIAAALGLFSASCVFVRVPNSSPNPSAVPAAFVSVGVGSSTLPAAMYPVAINLLGQALGAGISLDQVFSFNASGTFAMAGDAPWVAGFGSGGFASGIYTNPAG